jgi:hypothetical protein
MPSKAGAKFNNQNGNTGTKRKLNK